MTAPAASTTASDTLALLRYRLLLAIAVLPVLALTVFQALKHKDGRYLVQRFGAGYPRQQNPTLWVHAASVGEVLAVLPLIQRLLDHYPRLNILLSTTTPTGGKIARQKLPQVQHQYLPLDLALFTKRFLGALNAKCGLIMETELWPNLYATAKQQNIALLIINGRLSPKTMNTKPWVKQLYRLTLQKVTAVLAKSEADAQRFLQLGAKDKSTQAIGNIKFAIAANFRPPDKKLALPKPFVLAASTHENEEQIIARIWQNLNRKDYLLVIAPRHPYRAAGILKQLSCVSPTAAELSVTQGTEKRPLEIEANAIAVRSRGDPVIPGTKIYLADTLGELMMFMRDAEVVFMGGSLVPVGGHNILEPAMLGKAIVFGPYMHNFNDEMRQFLEQHAAIQVMDESELQRNIQLLLDDPAKRRAYGQRAELLMGREKNMVERYIEQINRYCDLGN